MSKYIAVSLMESPKRSELHLLEAALVGHASFLPNDRERVSKDIFISQVVVTV